MTCGGKRGEPVRITQEQTNVCTCPLAQAVIGARYEVFVYPQDDCPIHKPDCKPCEECGGTGIELHGHLKHCPCPIGQKMEHAEMNKGIENFDQPAPCVGCKGTRDITRRHKAGGHVLEYETVCPRCNGTGREP